MLLRGDYSNDDGTPVQWNTVDDMMEGGSSMESDPRGRITWEEQGVEQCRVPARKGTCMGF